jgi:hypothetical protein
MALDNRTLYNMWETKSGWPCAFRHNEWKNLCIHILKTFYNYDLLPHLLSYWLVDNDVRAPYLDP